MVPARTEPVEEAYARPTARRSRRGGGRPFLLVGVAGALVFAAHLALTATPSASADAFESAEPEAIATEPEKSDAPAAPVEKPATRVTSPAGVTAAAAAASTTPRVTSSPARVRMTPGPAFAGSVPVQPGADTVAPRAKAPVTPSPAAAVEPASPAPIIAPAPVELELKVPDLPGDSLMPPRTSDTMAMKKILRALNGSKP
jgi:hypothetical protein